jgi:hypothetical protein
VIPFIHTYNIILTYAKQKEGQGHKKAKQKQKPLQNTK